MALGRAEKILTSNLRAEEVSLESIGLDTVTPLLPFFSQLTRLKKLKIARNNLTSLPEDLSILRNLEYLDLSSNPISGLNAVIRGLFCLTNLKHLYIDLPFETDEDEIIVSLHSLESFNGTPLTETFEEGDVKQEGKGASPGRGGTGGGQQAQLPSGHRFDSSNAANQVPSVSAKTRWDDSDMSQVQRLYQAANSVSGRVVNKSEFDEYSRNVVSHLHTLLTGEEDPFKREGEILKAKKIMFEYCFEEIARSSHKFDANLSQVLSVLQNSYGSLLETHERLLKNVLEDKDRKLDVMKNDMQHAIQEIEQLMAQIDNKGGEAGGASRVQWETERRKLVEEIGWLRTENEKLHTKVRQAELGRPTTPGGAQRSINMSQGGGYSPNAPNQPPSIGAKALTLRKLKDVIDEICVSKSNYDNKCAESQLPRETMEQHMYTFLNQKYGLKHLILEWATAIIQGIKKYSAEDNTVAVFGKILRNEVDEEFRFVQRQLRETVAELLRVYIKGKYPLKSDDDVNAMMRKKINGTVSEEEWVDIVKYMYNQEDSVTIIMRIRDILKQRAAPKRRAAARRTASGGPSHTVEDDVLLTYQEFIRILLDFQLEGHERFYRCVIDTLPSNLFQR